MVLYVEPLGYLVYVVLTWALLGDETSNFTGGLQR